MEKSDKPTGNGSRKTGLGLRIALNIMAMIVTGIILVWIGTLWLDIWTHHGEFLVVPDVKGMSYDQARDRLDKEGFSVELTDSLYDTKTKPGTVLEQNPKCDTKVKEGRTVYLTVNAFSPRTVTIPNVVDTSQRQAMSVLQGLGLTKITVVEVPSEFKGLVLAVKRGNQRLMPGARVPVTADIILEVGRGLDDNPADSTDDGGEVDMEQLDLF